MAFLEFRHNSAKHRVHCEDHFRYPSRGITRRLGPTRANWSTRCGCLLLILLLYLLLKTKFRVRSRFANFFCCYDIVLIAREFQATTVHPLKCHTTIWVFCFLNTLVGRFSHLKMFFNLRRSIWLLCFKV